MGNLARKVPATGSQVVERLGRVGLAGAALLATGAANAAIDLTDVNATIADASGAVTSVSAAVLGVMIVIAAFKWIKRAF